MNRQTLPSPEQKLLMKQWDKHRGSIVMVVDDQIYSTKRAQLVNSMIKNIENKFHRRPLVTYVPKEGTLILFL